MGDSPIATCVLTSPLQRLSKNFSPLRPAAAANPKTKQKLQKFKLLGAAVWPPKILDVRTSGPGAGASLILPTSLKT